MIDKKDNLPDRLREINDIVDTIKPIDYFDIIKEMYKKELEDYDHIDNVVAFSLLKPGGILRYVKKYNKELRFGGLLLKVYSKDNKWYAIVKKVSGKKYHIAFETNYIFYSLRRDDRFRKWAELFITDVDNGEYIIE